MKFRNGSGIRRRCWTPSGKEFGYRFLIRSSLLLGGKANGQTVPGSREIVLSADSMEEALLYWAGHEVIHDLRVSYPGGL